MVGYGHQGTADAPPPITKKYGDGVELTQGGPHGARAMAGATRRWLKQRKSRLPSVRPQLRLRARQCLCRQDMGVTWVLFVRESYEAHTFVLRDHLDGGYRVLTRRRIAARPPSHGLMLGSVADA